MSQLADNVSKRIFSLDVFRGLIMFLLIAEAAGFHHSFLELTKGSAFSGIALQLHHHPWHGLRFWDLIQPFFMFIVGVAMPFSLRKRMSSYNSIAVTKHIVRRCVLLFAFGALLHCVYSQKLVWELWNVLVQLAFTILIAYAIMNLPNKIQISISIGLLLITELLYRLYNVESPYAENHESFGAYIDLLVMGKVNEGFWVFINFLPTAAHTIWGVICGKVLLSHIPTAQKLKSFLIWGTTLLILGFAIDLIGLTPIVKRIATSSFTLVSGGFAILSLSFFYWLIDIKGYQKNWLKVFSVVGTNSIFIYLFAETVGVQWVRGFGQIWTEGLLASLGIDNELIMVINSLFVLYMFWYITYFLDKQKVYFKV